jgi:hypothetical protein
MTKFKFVFLTLLSIACCQTAAAQPKFKNAADYRSKLAEQPLRIFLAKGKEDACGPGCREWIAVDGHFDLGSPARFQAFLKKTNAWKLPIFFESIGGSQSHAMEIGRILRGHRMTAGVSATDISCANDKPNGCEEQMKLGKPVEAELRSYKSRCNSACLTALLGAATRVVPAGASIGIHRTGFVCFRKNGTVIDLKENNPVSIECRRRLAERARTLSTYYDKMGADKSLFQDMDKVPNDQMRFLTKDELVRYRIETGADTKPK